MRTTTLAVLLLLGAVAMVTARSKCNCNCTLNYKPVCAVDRSGDSDTFPNECALECYNCTHDKSYVILRHSECSSTTTAKPRTSARQARRGRRSMGRFW